MLWLVGSAFMFISRFVLRIVLAIFDWTTEIFFGQIPSKAKINLALISLISVMWVVLLLGVPFPHITAYLYKTIPEQLTIRDVIIDTISTLGLFVLPLIAAQIAMGASDREYAGVRFLKNLVFSYHRTFLLGTCMVVMFVCSILIKGTAIIKRKKTNFIKCYIRKDQHAKFMQSLQQAFESYGFVTKISRAHFLYRFPIMLAGRFEKHIFDLDFSEITNIISGKRFSVYIHPTDIMINATEDASERLKIITTITLTENTAFMTWNEQSRNIENKLQMVASAYKNSAMPADEAISIIEKIKQNINKGSMDFEEWEALTIRAYALENMCLKDK